MGSDLDMQAFAPSGKTHRKAVIASSCARASPHPANPKPVSRIVKHPYHTFD